MADKIKKFYSFYCMSYLSEEQILSVLAEKQSQLRAYAFAYHDKDDNVNHHHILIYCYRPHTIKSIFNWFNRSSFVDEKDMPVNTFVENCISVKGSIQYLTHSNDKDKYQYDDSIVKGVNIDYFFDNFDDDNDNLTLALEDMMNGIPLMEIAKRYGRDFIIHYGHIKTLLLDIYDDYGITKGGELK